MSEGKPIFDVAGMATAIRYTEYKDFYSAISEIVDNSVEALATDIVIIVKETIDNYGKKTVGEIGILDNGTGMDIETLHGCLVFGSTTRKEHKSIGRFGVGLGQASMYAAPRVEVYSWQNNSESYMVYLDSNEMKESIQLTIDPPILKKLPSYFLNFVKCSLPKIGKFDFQNSGTFVLWRNVDKVSIKLSSFYTNMSQELGRRFRYFINDGKRIIVTSTSHSPIEQITPIDPLFLMESSRYQGSIKYPGLLAKEGDESETIFEPFVSDLTPNGEYILKIKLIGKDCLPFMSDIRFKCAVVKSKFYHESAQKGGYQNPGDTQIGKEVKKYEKVSVVRSGREIQFDRLGLYDSINDPANRWWRIEISFSSELDDFFTLSNNKQKVEIKTDYRSQEYHRKKVHTPQDEPVEDTELEAFAWKEFLHYFDTLMNSMKTRNKKVVFQTRTGVHSIEKDTKLNVVHSQKNPMYTDLSKSKDNIEIEYSPPLASSTQNTIGNNSKELKVVDHSFFQRITSLPNTNTFYDKKAPYFKVNKDDSGDICMINMEHMITKTFEERKDFTDGINYVLAQIISLRKQFRIFEEQKFFDKLVKELNSRFENLERMMEEQND